MKDKLTQMPTISEIRAAVVPLAGKYGLDRVFLFGSYARNEATPDSDVDLLVESDSLQSMADFIRLQEAFNVAIGKETDVVDASVLTKQTRAAKRFRNNIEKDKVILYERTE